MAFGWFKKNKASGADNPPPDAPVAKTEGNAGTEAIPDEVQPTAQPAFEAGAPPASPDGLLKRLRRGLTKTRRLLTTDIDDLFAGKNAADDELLEDLEEILITSDIGVQTATSLMERVSKKSAGLRDAAALKSLLRNEILALLREQPAVPAASTAKPHVVMVVGVNGVGKTTTIGKLAAKYAAAGKKVLVAAADTFRAAAVEQLAIWAERAGADLVRHKDGADPAAVAYDGMEAAFARGADVVLVDTAGRLHTKVNLMEELKKIKRSIQKKLPEAPQEILLVLDATTGQNALSQARLFNEALDITGLALTKLDGTAKGGIVVSITTGMNIPLKYIGVGEDLDDLQDFDAEQFVGALF